MEKILNFIDGKFVEPQSGEYLDNYNPATGEVYSKVAKSNATDVDMAVAAAKTAFPQWSAVTTEERSQYLMRIADVLEKSLKEFALAESIDQGKTVKLALDFEIPRAVKNLRFFATAVLHHEERSTEIDGVAVNYTVRNPMGVAALISPWNLPLYLLTWKIAPALATGNTAVCKPSEMTPMTAFLLGRVLQEAELPNGVCNIVQGLGSEAGDALTKHDDVKLISFTGGTATAGAIMQNAAPTFKKLSLELGGKNASVVFADADLQECLNTSLRAGFQNQGEICTCSSRVFVEHSIYDEFCEKYAAAVSKLTVGDPSRRSTFMGPLVSKEHKEKMLSYIDIARSDGGEILSGGQAASLDTPFSDGYFIEPTVIKGLDPKSKVMQEEIFGPIVCIAPFHSESEAIELANEVKYGLAATIWSENIKRCHRIAKALDAGTVWINTWMLRDLRLPFGGMKASGIGREGGKDSIDFFTEVKNICVKL